MSVELADSLIPFCQAPQRFLLERAHAAAPVARFRLHEEHFAVLCEPETSHAVLNGSPEDFCKGELYDIPRTTMGNGLITAEHDDWRAQHALLAPLFARRRMLSLQPVIADCVSSLLDDWQARAGDAVDLLPACKRVAFDVVSRGLLGLKDAALADALFHAMNELDRTESVRLYYLAKRFGAARSSGDAFERSPMARATEQMEQLTLALVDARLACSSQSDDLLGAALASPFVATLGAEARRRFLRDLVGTLLAAGYSTTGESLFWALYLLAVHPDVQERARAELVSAERGETARWNAPPYLSAVFNESQRLYPPVWFMGRIARRDLQVSGRAFEAGTRLLCSPLVLQQLPHYWPEPQRFLPERFLPDAAPIVARAFIPFGTGMRACLGRGLAHMEMAALLGSALTRFDLSLTARQPLTLAATYSMQPRESVHLVPEPRA